MLRRRQKSPRVQRHETPGPAAPAAVASQVRSRRRARPDAPVPPELRLPPDVAQEMLASPPPVKRPPGSQGVVLVTGFEPFGGEDVNPSWDLCRGLPETIAGLRVETCRVPCAFGKSIHAVARAIDKLRPALVVCLGQAGGRAQLSVERVAINIDDARIADNLGRSPVDTPVVRGGPPAYFATLPVKAMVAAMRAAGVPAELSNSAGTYVCNHLMYGVLHHLAAAGHGTRAGFIHVPYAEAQVLDRPGTPSMALATMARGVEAAIAAAATAVADLPLSEGKLD